MRNLLALERHVLYATTILETCLGLQKNCQEHQRPSPIGSADALRAYWMNLLRHIIPVPPGWCFDDTASCSCVLCAVMDLVSLSSWWSHDAKLADEFTLD